MKLNDLAEKIKIKIEINKKMDRLRRYIIKRNENKILIVFRQNL